MKIFGSGKVFNSLRIFFSQPLHDCFLKCMPLYSALVPIILSVFKKFVDSFNFSLSMALFRSIDFNCLVCKSKQKISQFHYFIYMFPNLKIKHQVGEIIYLLNRICKIACTIKLVDKLKQKLAYFLEYYILIKKIHQKKFHLWLVFSKDFYIY